MKRALIALLRAAMRIFYRRIELAGVEQIPQTGAVVFAVNHPNGLVDPLFLLCFAPRPVSFLAKAPLFRYPVIGWFTRTLDAIPVYRKQDHVAGTNAETFARAREVLMRGGGIAIFPEGTTHSDSQLRELKTGAARIALGANAPEMHVVPAGIYYRAKETFRSDALLQFGEAIAVPPATLDANGEPDAQSVSELTETIARGLDAVTLQAESRAALDLIARAERIFTANDALPLAEELEVRRRFVAGYRALCEKDAAKLAQLESAVRQLEGELGRARIEPEELTARVRPSTFLILFILMPLALLGAVIHYPAYRLIGFLAKRIARGEEAVVATIKFLAALLLLPLTWILVGLFRWQTGVLSPLLGYIALRFFESLDDVIGRVRAMTRRDLVERREALRKQMLDVAQELGVLP